MSGFLNIATKVVYETADFIQQSSRNLSQINIEKKSHNDFVTEVDKKAEELIKTKLSKIYPSHNFLGEEFGFTNNNSEYTWIIDPIDGTTNFIHSNPQYCISLGLKQNDKLICGVIYDPNRNDLYTAYLGKGAYLNNTRIRVSQNNLTDSLIATGFPNNDLNVFDTYLKIFKDISLQCQGHRRAGSAALDLAYVAAGYVDAFWEFNLKAWDVAAGIIIVKEAGGIVETFTGKPHTAEDGNIIAANGKIIKKLQKIIQLHIG